MSSFIITVLFNIFYYCFCLQGTSASRYRQEAFLEVLNDEGQQPMARAWLKFRAAQQDALETLKDGAT
jgi:hypothetical protein